jgi:hypothetical protein
VAVSRNSSTLQSRGGGDEKRHGVLHAQDRRRPQQRDLRVVTLEADRLARDVGREFNVIDHVALQVGPGPLHLLCLTLSYVGAIIS